MTDTNTAAGDLGMPGAQPAPTAPAAPPMSYAEADSRRAEFMQSAELRDKLMAGDVETTHLWKRITEGLSAPPETPAGQREELVEHINASSGYQIRPEVLEHVRTNGSITPDERRMTIALWESRKADPDWIARFNRGDLEARKEMALININLASPVRDPNPS